MSDENGKGNFILKSVKEINAYFRSANKADISRLLSLIILSERQEKIFDMYYIKRKGLGFIADTLCISYPVVKSELSAIRQKIAPLL